MALNIFLVEDNRIVRVALTDMLQETLDCHVVASAASEPEATRWLAEHPVGWDIAVIDLTLAQGNGLGVLASCRDRQPHQRAVVLTGHADPAIRARCAELAANAVFDKTTELDLLFAYCCGRDTPENNLLTAAH
ncbi:response regulator [Xylophilus sp. Kf1]|nr:response regulator [Xylophilus sp. Kf1]